MKNAYRILIQTPEGKGVLGIDGRIYIVTHMPIVRQRLGKNIPEVMLSTVEGHLLLGNEPTNTYS
jgi:hypothetical protein